MSLTPEQLEIIDAIDENKDPEAATAVSALTADQLKIINAQPLQDTVAPKTLHPAQQEKTEALDEPEKETDPSILADIGRVTADLTDNLDPVSVALNLKQMAEEAKGMFGFKNKASTFQALSKLRSEQNRIPLQTLETITGTEGSIYTPEGDIKSTETTTGAVLNIGAYVAGGWKASTLSGIKNLGAFRRGVIGGTIVNQVLVDQGDQNLFNVVDDALIEALPPNVGNDVTEFISFMAADENDTQLEQRLKLVGEELTLGVLGEIVGLGYKGVKGGVTGTRDLAYWSYKMFGKQAEKLTSTERGQIFMTHLKTLKPSESVKTPSPSPAKDSYFDEAEFSVDLKAPEGRILYEEAPEAVEQIAKQNGEGFSPTLKRITNQFFQSRGYWSKKAFNAFENSQYAQRQQIAKAENTANRLQKHLDDIVDTNEGETITKTVQDLFDGGLDFTFAKGLSFEDQVSDVSNQFNLPKNIATEMVNARNQIDSLSKDLVNSSAVPDDLKEAIVEGSGAYLRRSYRLYEDQGYVPTDDVTIKAKEYLIKQFQKFDVDLSDEFASNKADTFLKDLLNDADVKDTANYLQRVRKVNTAILGEKKDIAPELRAFMGEIKEPSENIILTVSKMAKLSETNKFFETTKDLGESGGYIFKDTATKDNQMFGELISGTNSNLDGMYTSKEMLKAIQDRQGQIGSVRENLSYRKYLKVQSVIQKFKTVYSHMTHMKNLTGGAIMSAANGVNPFGKNTLQTFRTLRNSVTQGGQAALDESYEKYLRLGIINTNVQVNEYRELLESGYRANATDGFKWIENSVPYGSTLNEGVKVGQKVLKRVEDVYVATDDFYKINTFLSELDTLKKANTGKSLDVLEAEAARITQNTYANYDRVPFGIKALKDLPIGSFVSFPAESIRVQANILRQGAKEIASGNPTLRARGAQRLSAMLVTNSSVGLGSVASAKFVFGNNDEKAEAAHILSEKPWSKVAPRIWNTDEEGKIYYWDTASHDPFTAVKDPVRIIINEIMSDNLKGEDVTKRIVDVSVEAALSIAKPFYSATILADVADDVVYAVFDPAGRTRKGKEMFPAGLSASDRAANVGYHILNQTMPGTLKSGADLISVMNEKPNRLTGKTKSLGLEFQKNLTSANVEELDVQDAVLFSVLEHNRELKNILSFNPDYEKSTTELKKRYGSRQQQKYRVEQELYRKVKASIALVGEDKTAEYLLDADMSRDKLALFMLGLSNAEKPSKDKVIAMLQKSPSNTPTEVVDTINEIVVDYQSMMGVPLNVPKDPTPLALEKMKRMRRSTGGEISEPVANAPTEPDERINKITGLPYNEGAGVAYMDTDDPLRAMNMAAGGRVKKGAGSILLKEAIEKVVAPALKKAMKPTEAVEEVVETAAQRKARRVAENSDSSETQIGSTEGTAKKAIAYLDEQGAEGLTLDYGAGFGKNAKAVKADETFEPFPKEGFKPSYIDSALIPEGRFGRLISTNVLNVLPRDIRDDAVLTIGKSLKEGGQAVVQAWDISAIKARLKGKNFKTGEEANSSRSLEGGKFQKGFSKAELRDYVQETLGDGFEVSTVPNKRGISMSSVLIKKLAKEEERLQKNCGGKVLDTLRRNNR
tara:strand:+ start:4247 stop:9052 length:4806 start_codon:yes stop_codon:yes gene_type:complete